MKAYFSFLIICIIAVSCTSKAGKTESEVSLPEHLQKLKNLSIIPADASPTKTIRFEEEHQYGRIYLPGRPLAPVRGFGPKNAIDEKGRVYRTDLAQGNIKVFDATGKQIEVIGRFGKGPGEFENITSIFTKNDTLLVFDSNILRVSTFDANTLELLKTESFDPLEIVVPPNVKFPRPYTLAAFNENFLTAFVLNEENGRLYNGYFEISEESEILSDQLFRIQKLKMHQSSTPNFTIGVSLEFSSEGLFDVSKDGTIYLANSEEFLISVLNSDGEQTQSIYVPFKKATLQKDKFEENLSSHMKSVYKDVDYPETWPALDDLFVDDENRLWVSTIVEDKSIREWWVLDPSGELIAKFNWPTNDKIINIRNGRFYVEKQEVKYQSAKVVVSYFFNFMNEGLN